MDPTRAQQLHERRKAVANTIAEAHAHALLITDLRNVEYLTGFRGSSGAFLLRADGTGEREVLGRDAGLSAFGIDAADAGDDTSPSMQ